MSAAKVSLEGALVIPDALVRRWLGLVFGLEGPLSPAVGQELVQACRLLLTERAQTLGALGLLQEERDSLQQGVTQLFGQVERTVAAADSTELERLYVAQCYRELLDTLDRLHARWMEFPVTSAGQHALLGQLMDDLVDIRIQAEEAAQHAAHHLEEGHGS